MEYFKAHFYITLCLLFIGSAQAAPTSSVTPSSGQVGQTLTFEVSLGIELPVNHDTRISFGNGSGGWLSWHEMTANFNKSVYTYPRAFSESGLRNFRYSIFKNGAQFGTIAEKTVNVFEKPPFYFDEVSSSSPINQGDSFTFRSLWERSSNSAAFIVDAKVRYKKRTSSSWATSTMAYDGSNGIRERFKKTASFSSSGDYEYQFQASQSKDGRSVATPSSWTSSFYFTVNQPISTSKPDLTVTSFTISENQLTVGEQFQASATIKNIGDAPTTAGSKVYYYIKQQSGLILDNNFVDSDNVRVLAVNATDNESDTLDAPNVARDYWVYACASGSVPAEKTLVNNCKGPEKITVTQPPQPDPEIVRVDSDKDTYTVGELAIFYVPLTHKASKVTMSIMPAIAREESDTVWYFERIFDSAGPKTITFSAENAQGIVTDTATKTVTVVEPASQETISVVEKPLSDRISENSFSLKVRGESQLGIEVFSLNIQPYGVSSPIANTQQSQSVSGNALRNILLILIYLP